MQFQELQEIRDAFLDELQHASRGQKTSLPFIKHPLSQHPVAQVGDLFQVLMIGGTVYQNALFRKTMQGLEVEERTQGKLPALVSKEAFLQFIAAQLNPTVKVVAINFAYAMMPIMNSGVLDGKLEWGSKEHTFEGLIGATIGHTISDFVKATQQRDITVSVANDTICLLLSGLKENAWKESACGIVGTGVNFAFFLDEHTAVNIESAEFDRFELSESAKEMDAKSASPGSALLEKEISGAYLYQKYNIEIEKAGIETEKIQSSEQLNQISLDQSHPGHAIAAAILERSAQFTAIQISALMEYHQTNITFCMSGSLFWEADAYKEKVEQNVKQLSPTFTATYEKNEDAELFGAAKLVS